MTRVLLSVLLQPWGAAAAVVAVLACAAPAPASAQPASPVQLIASDLALLHGVRLAGLWEIPAGQMAAERGNTARVREVGQMIAEQHIRLDELVVDAANRLGAALPATPNAEQQGWLAEMQKAPEGRFDQVFVDRLRAAHGKIFPVIGAVRAGTRNPVIRKLAADANEFVMNHMKILESTGLVRYDRLAPVALPAAPDTSGFALARANAGAVPMNQGAVLVVLLGAVGIGGLVTVRMLAQRRR